jgi:hypothetical protein
MHGRRPARTRPHVFAGSDTSNPSPSPCCSAAYSAPSPPPTHPHPHPHPRSLLRHALMVSALLTALASVLILWLPTPRPPTATRTASGAVPPVKGSLRFLRMHVLQQRGAQLLMAVRLLMALAFHMFAPIWQVSIKVRRRRPTLSPHTRPPCPRTPPSPHLTPPTTTRNKLFPRMAAVNVETRCSSRPRALLPKARPPPHPGVLPQTRFNFGPYDHAQFMGLIGLTYALAQGFIAKPLVRYFGAHAFGGRLDTVGRGLSSALGGCTTGAGGRGRRSLFSWWCFPRLSLSQLGARVASISGVALQSSETLALSLPSPIGRPPPAKCHCRTGPILLTPCLLAHAMD